MRNQARLERACGRLLAFYPRAFREESGDELIAVLMADTPNGRTRPGLAASVDLIRGGLRMRLRYHTAPRSPQTVRAAVRLMHAGAALTTCNLILAIIWVVFVDPSAASLRLFGQTQPLPVAIAFGTADAVVLITLWLWMARANGHGRKWARIASTLLVGLATLQLASEADIVQVALAVPAWLVGLAAVWLLWRPSSGGFFAHRDATQPGQ
jgi:hypothetical protein